MSSYFNLKHLTESEAKTQEITRNTLQGIRDNIPDIIDLLFKLEYFFGELENISAPRGYFQFMCCTHFFQAPFSFWILYGLYETGYYLEANIIYRHLIEAFIQMKYFHKYPEKAESQLTRKNFKVMFEEFAPGYYEKYYHLLCDTAHGVLCKDLYRVDRKSTSEGRVRMGCEFNILFATAVINSCVVLLYGYLNIFEVIFPRTTIKKDRSIYELLQNKKAWLMSAMESHKKEIPTTEDWYGYTFKLIL